MRSCLILCAMLLAGCGHNAQPARIAIPPEFLALPTGYEGPTPSTEGEMVDAMIADRRALGQCSAQIGAIAALE